jgi:hypothetical protein
MGEQRTTEEQRSVRALVEQIETLRLARRDAYAGKTHPAQKRFTQEELDATVFPSYRNLLQGRSQRVSSRAVLIAIAAYLECTHAERNSLLAAAQYVPEPSPLEGVALKQALDTARQTIQTLPFPAVVVTPDEVIQDVNFHWLGLTQL